MGSIKDIAGRGVGKEMNRGVKLGSERKQGPQGRKKGTGRRLHTREFLKRYFARRSAIAQRNPKCKADETWVGK